MFGEKMNKLGINSIIFWVIFWEMKAQKLWNKTGKQPKKLKGFSQQLTSKQRKIRFESKNSFSWITKEKGDWDEKHSMNPVFFKVLKITNSYQITYIKTK